MAGFEGRTLIDAAEAGAVEESEITNTKIENLKASLCKFLRPIPRSSHSAPNNLAEFCIVKNF
jgi:hypothetical protein